jgi:predicted DNA-binding protein with PD1-like motif
MTFKKLHEEGGLSQYVLVFQKGDEPMSGLLDFARQHRITAARFSAIGAFSDAVVQYFDWETKEYQSIPLDEQMEVLSLIGDISLKDDEPQVHAHVVLGRPDGTTRGGHLKEAHVRPTLEVMLTQSPAHLQRRFDSESGLALIRP